MRIGYQDRNNPAWIYRCIVSKDVYSANGQTLLIERGSKIIGEQTSALLQGQARVFVLWNELETPTGVKVPLASPGAGLWVKVVMLLMLNTILETFRRFYYD